MESSDDLLKGFDLRGLVREILFGAHAFGFEAVELLVQAVELAPENVGAFSEGILHPERVPQILRRADAEDREDHGRRGKHYAEDGEDEIPSLQAVHVRDLLHSVKRIRGDPP